MTAPDWKLLMARDRRPLEAIWKKLSAGDATPVGPAADRFWENFRASAQLLSSRLSLPLRLEYDPELPISQHRQEIMASLMERKCLIVCGETGSGKSTQLPKICLEAGLGRSAVIGHTQPRRIAARSIAARLAEELGSPLGQAAGFKMRFSDRTDPKTLVKLMTDGVLLAEIQRDRWLEQYDAIILDEAHERSLNIDLLIGYLKRVIARRPDFRLIVTSATIDAERFAEHFGDAAGPAPIFTIAGRTYPVELRYRPVLGDSLDEEDRQEASLDQRLCEAMDELLQDAEGDLLIFLPTEREIRETAQVVRGHLVRRGLGDRFDLLPLYARLAESDQDRIFHPGPKRRIVLATNVAESSLTVPRIGAVIDTGTARISRFAPRSKVQRLPIEPISQASANQRAGRCGRLFPGICVRLYSETDFQGRSPFTTPEIRRSALAGVLLQMKLVGIDDLESFPWLDPPRPEMIREGIATLRELQALDGDGRLTPIGRMLGRWPVDPRVGRMLIAASENRCLADVLVIASALEVLDPRIRPPEKQQAADEAHQIFLDPHSDFISYLKLWDQYQRWKADLGRSRLQKACESRFLSMVRLREWSEVHRQLLEQVEAQGLKVGRRWVEPSSADADVVEKEPDRWAPSDPYRRIHQSLLTGLLSGVAMADQEGRYQGAHGITFTLWPGSGLRGTRPKWIVAAEVVETTQRYGRTVARIDPRWIEPMAGHLLDYHYDAPFFSRRNGAASVQRRGSLFGLPIVPRHPVPLAPIDPALARRLLIDQGLSEGELASRARFYQSNRKTMAELERWAACARQRQWIIDPYRLQQFYEQHLPKEVVDRRSLEAWDATIDSNHPIYLDAAQWIDQSTRQGLEEQFPADVQLASTKMPVVYRFQPGAETDGATLSVPQPMLAQISYEQAPWWIPGWMEEWVVALIKSLPKRLRSQLVPASHVAQQLIHQWREEGWGKKPFWPTLTEGLSRVAEQPIERKDFQWEKIPEHLKIRFEVVGPEGKSIGASRDLEQLKQQFVTQDTQPRRTEHRTQFPWLHQKHQAFPDLTIPKQISVDHHGMTILKYPALSAADNDATLEWFDDPETAIRHHRQGLWKLLSIADRKEVKMHLTHLPGISRSLMLLGSVLPKDRMMEGLGWLLITIAYPVPEVEVWSPEEWNRLRSNRVERLGGAADEVARWLPEWAEAHHRVSLKLEGTPRPSESVRLAIQNQTLALYAPSFLQQTPWEWLREFPRYLKGMVVRCDKSAGQLPKDQATEDILKRFWDAWEHRPGEDRQRPIEYQWQQFRWAIEELRVSLFAQALGTRIAVSPKRLEKMLESLLQRR